MNKNQARKILGLDGAEDEKSREEIQEIDVTLRNKLTSATKK